MRVRILRAMQHASRACKCVQRSFRQVELRTWKGIIALDAAGDRLVCTR